MAANFWTSSHCKKLLEQEDIAYVPPIDQERGITTEDTKIIKAHLSTYIRKLAQSAKVRQRNAETGPRNVEMPFRGVSGSEMSGNISWLFLIGSGCFLPRVVATAIAYFRRIYTRKSFSEYDPRLVAPTCLYLASKAEESTVQAKLLVFCMKRLFADEKLFRYEIKDVLEMEMRLLEALDYYLVIYHPYRPLVQLLQDSGMTDLIQTTWALVNDSYGTDLILMYPPYLIALACIYIGCILKEKDARVWFEELRIDMNVITQIKNIAVEILDFYDNYRQIPEERVHAAFSKLPPKS